MEKSHSSWWAGNMVLTFLAIVYAAGASLAAFQVVTHTQDSTKAIEAILNTYNMKNEGAQALDRVSKEHPFLSMFMADPVKEELKLPSQEESAKALNSDVKDYLKQVRLESKVAAWWSWGLLNFSFFYIVIVIALERSFTARGVVFALTTVSLACFSIGVIAPAMVVWTAPSIPMASGNLEFVVQHQVRGIAAILWELIKTGHFIIGGFLLLFSIITPLTKASLTYFVTACHSPKLNHKIGQFLHTIGKWSMADVFVAAILLSLYALKAQQATKSIPCLGLYYFTGYCLFSLSTTELLVHSGLVEGGVKEKADTKLGPRMITGLFIGLVCFFLATSAYTWQQYTKNTKEKISSSESPIKLNNADLVLPAHK